MNAAVTLENLTLAYHRHPAVHHVSGSFREGIATAIIGPNGAGKSTLLKALVGLVSPNHGRVQFHQLSRGEIAYLPQPANIERQFPISVLDTVLLGDWKKSRWLGGVSRTALAQAEDALAAVGLAGFSDRPVGSLSVGQFQRVLFARLMVQDAAMILLDEPFNAIDQKTTADLMRVVAAWQAEGRTVIAALHDLEQVKREFPDALLMARELVEWGPARQILSPENLARARALSASWSDPAAICER